MATTTETPRPTVVVDGPEDSEFFAAVIKFPSGISVVVRENTANPDHFVVEVDGTGGEGNLFTAEVNDVQFNDMYLRLDVWPEGL